MNPWYAASAHTCTSRSLAALASVTASRAPLQSATSAGVTASPHTSPRVSTHTCRLIPVTLFPPVEPAGPRLLGRPHGLAVGDAGRRLGVLPPLGRPHGPPQGVLDPVPGAVRLPLREVPEGRVPVGQVGRQGPPRAPLADGVHDGVQQGPAGVLGRPPARLVGRDQGFQDRPLGVRQPGRELSRGRHPCRFHDAESNLDRSTDSRLLSQQALTGIGEGDSVRDWQLVDVGVAVLPHEAGTFKPRIDDFVIRYLWPLKTVLANRVWFRKTQRQRGLQWFEYSHISRDKFATPLSIAFGEVVTHNHFVLDHGRNVFKNSAPVIKLLQGSQDTAYLHIAGFLNSSAAGFWLRRVCHNKGLRGQVAVITSELWEQFVVANSTNVSRFPLPDGTTLSLAVSLATNAQLYTNHLPAVVCMQGVPTRADFDDGRQQVEAVLRGR